MPFSSSEQLKIMISLMKNSPATVLAFKLLPTKQTFQDTLADADTVTDATSVPFSLDSAFCAVKSECDVGQLIELNAGCANKCSLVAYSEEQAT